MLYVSAQGWRVSMEDAHAVELELDVDTAFFAVYDGHGGSEVWAVWATSCCALFGFGTRCGAPHLAAPGPLPAARVCTTACVGRSRPRCRRWGRAASDCLC